MTREVDARGLSCPLPAVLVKRAMDQGEKEISVVADDPAAVDNIRRLAETTGYTVSTQRQGSDTLLRLWKQ